MPLTVGAEMGKAAGCAGAGIARAYRLMKNGFTAVQFHLHRLSCMSWGGPEQAQPHYQPQESARQHTRTLSNSTNP